MPRGARPTLAFPLREHVHARPPNPPQTLQECCLVNGISTQCGVGVAEVVEAAEERKPAQIISERTRVFVGGWSPPDPTRPARVRFALHNFVLTAFSLSLSLLPPQDESDAFAHLLLALHAPPIMPAAAASAHRPASHARPPSAAGCPDRDLLLRAAATAGSARALLIAKAAAKVAAGGEGWAVACEAEREAAAQAVARAVTGCGGPCGGGGPGGSSLAGGVAILLDTSGSVSPAEASIAAGAASAVHAALARACSGGPPPSLAVIQFSHNTRVEAALAPVDGSEAGRAAFTARLAGIQAMGQGTDVAGALAAGAAALSPLPPGAPKAVILITDGQFSASGYGPAGWMPGAPAQPPPLAAPVVVAGGNGVGALWRPRPRAGQGPPIPPPPAPFLLHHAAAAAPVAINWPPAPAHAAASLGSASIALFVWAVGRTCGEEAMRAVCAAARAGGPAAASGMLCEGGGFLNWHAQDGRHGAAYL